MTGDKIRSFCSAPWRLVSDGQNQRSRDGRDNDGHIVSVAQQPAFRRTELQRADLSAAGREAVTVMVEVPSGAMSGRHSHPGEEIGYVLEGAIVVEIDGEPTTGDPGTVGVVSSFGPQRERRDP